MTCHGRRHRSARYLGGQALLALAFLLASGCADARRSKLITQDAGNPEAGSGGTAGSSGSAGSAGIGGVGVDASVDVDAGLDASVGVDAGADVGVGVDAGVDGSSGADASVAADAGADATVGVDAGPVCDIDRSVQRRGLGSVPKVFFGTVAPTLVGLTPGQVLAIGRLNYMVGPATATCSGTLITPTVVLTAKHCTTGQSPGALRFSIGYAHDAPDQQFMVATVHEHGSSDLALLVLSESAVARVPGLLPIRIFQGTLDASWLGRVVEAAGYGETHTGELGTRYFTAQPIVRLMGNHVSVDGQGYRGLCGGDSGGPLLTQGADGSVRVIGGLERGDQSCVGVDDYTRVDLFRAWIEERTGPMPVIDAAQCDVLGEVGRCVQGQPMYCAGDGDVVTLLCGVGQTCGWSTTADGFRCVQNGTDPCNGYGALGVCEGDVAKACVGGVLQVADCGACGLRCAQDTMQGVECAEPPPHPCDSLDYQGRCNGQVAEWCVNGEFRNRNCALFGQTCGWRGTMTGYYCG